jgi:hypothetical protein
MGWRHRATSVLRGGYENRWLVTGNAVDHGDGDGGVEGSMDEADENMVDDFLFVHPLLKEWEGLSSIAGRGIVV